MRLDAFATTARAAPRLPASRSLEPLSGTVRPYRSEGISGTSSPCSSRSASARNARAFALATATSRLDPYARTPGRSTTSPIQRPSSSRSISTVKALMFVEDTTSRPPVVLPSSNGPALQRRGPGDIVRRTPELWPAASAVSASWATMRQVRLSCTRGFFSRLVHEGSE